jgi:hypothetical protein
MSAHEAGAKRQHTDQPSEQHSSTWLEAKDDAAGHARRTSLTASASSAHSPVRWSPTPSRTVSPAPPHWMTEEGDHPVIMLTKTHTGGEGMATMACARAARCFPHGTSCTCGLMPRLTMCTAVAQLHLVGQNLDNNLTTKNANGEILCGIGMRLQQEARFGIYVASLTPNGS